MVVSTPSDWQAGTIIPLTITDLTDQGEGLGHYQGRVVFVPNTVPGDAGVVRLIKTKPRYGVAQLQELLHPSDQRVAPVCPVADRCGGCQWQSMGYGFQLQTKQQIVQDALERIGKLTPPAPIPILAAEQVLHYRNKVTYPIQQSKDGRMRMGYYATSSHTLIDLQHCPVQDERLEPFLQQIKQDLQMTGWSAYQEQNHQGTLRHLGLRIGRRTGEVLLTLVVKDRHLQGIETWAEQWIDRYPRLIGVCLNHNCTRTNTIFAEETVTVAGRSTLREEFAGFTLEIDSTSFFQIYTEQAERFFWWIVDQLHLSGSETIIDAFCGIGTLTLLLAQQARRVIGIEAWPDAIRQAQINARHNQILNTEFLCGTVEAILPTLSPSQIVVLDPPRKGCEAKVLATIGHHQPQQVVYISCNPATLARDLQILLADGGYELWQWRAADFFPQTVHVESVAFLRRKNAL